MPAATTSDIIRSTPVPQTTASLHSMASIQTASPLHHGVVDASQAGHAHFDDSVLQKSQLSKKSHKRKSRATANLYATRYEVVHAVVEQAGMQVSKEDDPKCYLIWSDSFVQNERIAELKSYQRLNHFPGMGEICRKDCLARNISKMNRKRPEEYNFTPRTWIFPAEYSTFQTYTKELRKRKKQKTFIVKPANGAMGNGISLYRNGEKIPQNEHIIVQEYMDKPFLLDGYKFDLRVYVLVTSCDPLRVFLYQDGLVRMGTEKYHAPTDGNIDELCMHLTNYSVNKRNENFQKDEDVSKGSKRSIRYLNNFLSKNGYDVPNLWFNIQNLIMKTLIVAEPHVLHAYRMCRAGSHAGNESVCFEVLGFDIFLDKKLKPWVFEVNRSPSFGTDEKIDYDIKSGLLGDAIKLMNIRVSDKRKSISAERAEAERRLLGPTKRPEHHSSKEDRGDRHRKIAIDKRKEELKQYLNMIRLDRKREEYENRHMGGFRRIFPTENKSQQAQWTQLLDDAFQLFLSGRAPALQKDMTRAYSQYKEAEILDMIEQCEEDSVSLMAPLVPRGPKFGKRPYLEELVKQRLSSMPTADVPQPSGEDTEDTGDEAMWEKNSPPTSPSFRRRQLSNGPPQRSRPTSSFAHRLSSETREHRSTSRPLSSNQLGKQSTGSQPVVQRTRSLTRPLSATKRIIANHNKETTNVKSEREEQLTKRTLTALTDMRIKFPGKTDEEADTVLDAIESNWKYHKPRIASYWLVKLDSIKRRKVIDIVRMNIRALLQRVWHLNDVDNLALYRIFCRVFNRLLWSHGQGLWNCFSTSQCSWETIFSKSTDVISPLEMSCCRRIVQLCRQCLLIVYQFAAETKNAVAPEPVKTRTYPGNEAPKYTTWNNGNGAIAQRPVRPGHPLQAPQP
ncbi:PREDICTED: tubulin polyglutamylase TTLL7-like isoform X2 [Branchiostoma belcheri]|uniref:Tubulin polyglutamylase TTLL7-like isoform X2 n=1 Tax=Branchiostoma belcheri TaxID=7741 RepID=A0A6P4ZJN3_BRABE|nr:PREDICTED: tubulin polyglutamylase TTLL7-like isoform X2 [Branchiostoma belcheri]